MILFFYQLIYLIDFLYLKKLHDIYLQIDLKHKNLFPEQSQTFQNLYDLLTIK